METILRKLQHSFEQAYHQQVIEMNLLKKNIYFVQTKLDRYVLKCFVNYPNISWQDKFLSQMLTKGAKGIVPFVKNKDAKNVNYLTEEKLYYAVMPFIPGKGIDYGNLQHITDCIKLLGQFHAYGSGLYGKEQHIPFRSQIYERWRNRLEDFERSLREVEEQEAVINGLLPFVREYGQHALEWARFAMHQFPRAYMLYLEEQAQLERQIAHLDVAPHNFLTLEHQQYYLLDYDLVDYFPPLIDVIQYINRVLSYHNWSFELVGHLIRSYETHFPLPNIQKKYIPLLLIYPNDFFREWLGLWRRKPGFHPEKVHNFFQQLEDQWSNRCKFVQRCISMLQ